MKEGYDYRGDGYVSEILLILSAIHLENLYMNRLVEKPNIQILAEVYRNLGYPIIHAVKLYHQDGSNVDPCRRKAIMNGRQIVIACIVGAESMD